MSGLSARTASKDLSDCSLDWISVSGALATLVEADVALLVDDAEELLGASPGEPLAGGLARKAFRLADMRHGAHVRVGVQAGVQRDHRDAGVDGLLHRRADGLRIRRGDGEPVDLLGDGGLDHLGLLLGVVVGLAVAHRDAEVLARVFGALLGDGPERAAVAVRDDGDGEVAALRHLDVVVGGLRVAAPVVTAAVGGRAAACTGKRGDQHQEQCPERALLHGSPPPPAMEALQLTPVIGAL
jgi:hypothetical protein